MLHLSDRAAIPCENCGRDFSRDYWEASSYWTWDGLEPRPDPIVCRSCRRDLNPDAADFPRWTPERAANEARVQLVSESRKKCRTCGGEWDGLIFGPTPAKGSPLPFGTCPTCSAADEARDRKPMRPVQPEPELTRPTRVFGYED